MRKSSTAISSVGGQFMGLDLGDRYSQVCVLDARGKTVYEGRVATTPAALERFLKGVPRLRVAIEAGTHSPWVARLGTACGHELIVANTRKVRLIGKNTQKSDRLDAERLARLARVDPQLLEPIQHRGEREQQDLALLRSRDALVRVRTLLVNHVRGTLKSCGVRAGRCSTETFARHVLPQIPEGLKPALLPVLEILVELRVRIARCERTIEQLTEERYPVASLLRDVPGVGPITSLGYVLTLAEPRRFLKSRDVAAYVGLVPRKHQSGERDPQMHITKTGDRLLRRLLVGAAQYILGPFAPECDLRRFGQALLARGGPAAKKRAVVAVARKLAVLLHRLWITGEVYDPDYGARRTARLRRAAG